MNRLWLRSCPLWYEVFGIIILESFTQKTPDQVSEVNRCLRAGKPESDIMSLNESLSIMATMDRIREQGEKTHVNAL